MRRLEYFQNGVLLTGAAGFLGSHLANALRGLHPSKTADADVRDRSTLDRLAPKWPSNVVLHLASKGTVHTTLAESPEMMDVAVDGLVNLSGAFAPKLVVLSSSCAIYGETGNTPALPSRVPNPLSIYGLSKVISERILSQWAEETGNAAVVLRIGNLVGKGGRGLAAYLVNHGIRHPEGTPVAKMRGGGRMVRDFVPVDYVVRIFEAVIRENWEPGRLHCFNAGTGKPRTNGQLASVVQHTLRERGIELNIQFDEHTGPGEARCAVLDTSAVEERLGLTPPSESDIDEAIREAVLYQLEHANVFKAQPASI